MPTSIRIPDNYMSWVFDISEISEEEEYMFSRQSIDFFSSKSLPCDNPVFIDTITNIFCREGKSFRDIAIYIGEDAIFCRITRTPVSPEDNPFFSFEGREKKGKLYPCSGYIITHDRGGYGMKSETLSIFLERLLIDPIARSQSLTPRERTDETDIRIAPNPLWR